MLNNKLSKIQEKVKQQVARPQSTSSSSGTKSSFSSRKAANLLLMDDPIMRPGRIIQLLVVDFRV